MPFFGRSYSPPSIPVTPSKRINDFVNSRCNKFHHSFFKYAAATFVCAVLSLCVRIYNALSDREDKKPNRIKWMIACTIVGLVLGLLTWYAVIFNTLYYMWVYITGPVGSFLFYNLCDYGCLVLGAMACVLIAVCIILY